MAVFESDDLGIGTDGPANSESAVSDRGSLTFDCPPARKAQNRLPIPCVEHTGLKKTPTGRRNRVGWENQHRSPGGPLPPPSRDLT